MYLKTLFLTLAFLLLTPIEFSYCTERLYEIRDLIKLAERKNYNEFFKHYKDISPTNRNDQYEELVLKMVLLKGDFLAKKDNLTKSEYIQFYKWKDYLNYSSNEFFQAKLRKVFFSYIKSCLDSEAYLNCNDIILSSWPELKNHELSLILYPILEPIFYKEVERSLILRSTFNGDIEILEKVAAPALLHPMAEFYCKSNTFNSIIKKLIMNAPLNLNDYNQYISKKFHSDCLTSLKPKISKWFFEADLKGKTQFAPLLNDQGSKHYLSLLKILNDEKDQNELNKAWRDLKSLKESSRQRSEVLKRIKQDKNLTITYLQKMSKAKKEILSRYLGKNFPELSLALKERCTRHPEEYCQSL